MNKIEGFDYKEAIIGGDGVMLITPKDMSIKWTEENKHLRSCIIRKSDQKIISLGFRKFVNFSEQPAFEPWQDGPFEAWEKKDGSLLIISRYKGEWIIRTRGTFDARNLANGHEIDFLINKYPKIFDSHNPIYESKSVLCEWETPNNVIVVRDHSEPNLTLLNIIDHDTLLYKDQCELDILAQIWDIGRPIRYQYDSVQQCIDDVQTWKGREGVVLYQGQTLKKIKATEYLRLHRAKSSISSITNLIELFVESGCDNASDFYQYVETTLDHELANIAKNDIDRIGQTYEIYKQQYSEVKSFVSTLEGTRKEQAISIISRWTDWRKTLAFIILDRKTDNIKISNILEELCNK